MDFKTHLYQPNRRSMVRFLSGMISYLGLAFHPDNYAEEYVRLGETDEQVFTEEECKIINENLKMAHGFFGEAIYDQSNMIVRYLNIMNR